MARTIMPSRPDRWEHVCRQCGRTFRANSSKRPFCSRQCSSLRGAAVNTRHGACVDGRQSPEWATWWGMRMRCSRTTARFYKNYGGRGIRVCDRWLGEDGFAKFLADVGPKPSPKHQLDRINNDGHYEPGNVRWTTRAVQMRNRRTNHMVSANGETLCVTDWARRLGVDPACIIYRLRRGWDHVRAVTEPRYGPRGALSTATSCRSEGP